MNKVLGFKYTIVKDNTFITDHFQSNSDKYIDAIDELIDHVYNSLPNGGELIIKKIIIYKLVNKK